MRGKERMQHGIRKEMEAKNDGLTQLQAGVCFDYLRATDTILLAFVSTSHIDLALLCNSLRCFISYFNGIYPVS